MIDTHCHLVFPEFAGQVPALLEEARLSGVVGAITVATGSHDVVAGLELAKIHPRVWCTSGVHPLYSDRGPHDWGLLRLVASDPKCVAWGELGLDHFHSSPSIQIQRAVLEEQLAWIESCQRDGLNLPVVLHCREAFAELIPILSTSSINPSRCVFHCFTGSVDDARVALDFGAMLSFTGVLTYRNAQQVREAALLAPADRIMVETDAPYLSPEPHRGIRPCRPVFVRSTAERLAEIRGVSFTDIDAQLNMNTSAFFGIDIPGADA